MTLDFAAMLERLRTTNLMNHDGEMVLTGQTHELVIFSFEDERAISLIADNFLAPGIVAVIADEDGDHTRILRQLALIFRDVAEVFTAPPEQAGHFGH